MIATERLLEVFVEVADTLVDDYDVIDFLHRLTDHVADISGAEAVGLLLADHLDQLHFMAASTEGARHIELFQLQNSQGPCLDCFRFGAPVAVGDLNTARDRWPEFTPQALDVGFRSVHAFPLRLRDRVIGAMNVFGTTALPLVEREWRIVQALADVATIALIKQESIAAAEVLTEQLQGALNSRIVIEQAKGMVARSRGLSVEEAFEVIRRHARGTGARLADVAQALVTRQLDPETLPLPPG